MGRVYRNVASSAALTPAGTGAHAGAEIAGGLMVRYPTMLAAVLLGVLPSLAPAHAAAVPGPGIAVERSPDIVEVDRRCGPGRHFVPGHRNRRGLWVRSHCAPNRRR
jgi:hypothetical protein